MYTFAALFTLKFSANMSPIPGLPVRTDIQVLAYRVVPDPPVTKHTIPFTLNWFEISRFDIFSSMKDEYSRLGKI
jgi:hypothetical protein